MLPRGLYSIVIVLTLLGATNSASGQTRRRTTPTSRSPTASSVYSRYIEAVKKRDFKTIVDLTFTYQQEVAQIKSANPRALWPKLIDEYYSQKINNLTEASSFWSDLGRQTMAMMGDPSQGLRAIFYLTFSPRAAFI
jgi:hypothetical protein